MGYDFNIYTMGYKTSLSNTNIYKTLKSNKIQHHQRCKIWKKYQFKINYAFLQMKFFCLTWCCSYVLVTSAIHVALTKLQQNPHKPQRIKIYGLYTLIYELNLKWRNHMDLIYFQTMYTCMMFWNSIKAFVTDFYFFYFFYKKQHSLNYL